MKSGRFHKQTSLPKSLELDSRTTKDTCNRVYVCVCTSTKDLTRTTAAEQPAASSLQQEGTLPEFVNRVSVELMAARYVCSHLENKREGGGPKALFGVHATGREKKDG